jgi:hypothetical protein
MTPCSAVDIYQTSRLRMLDDSALHSHRSGNLIIVTDKLTRRRWSVLPFLLVQM